MPEHRVCTEESLLPAFSGSRICERDADRVSQNNTQDKGSRPSAGRKLLRDKRAVAIVAGGILAIAVIVGVIALAWPGTKPAEDDSASASWSEPMADSDYRAEEGVIDQAVFTGTVLPETEDAGREYVEETLFLGDSNTYRYMFYGDETGEAFTSLDNTIGVVSMGAGAIATKPCMEFQGQSKLVTMPQAVKIMQPRRIIIGFGSNNLGAKTETFIKEYRKGLQAVHEAYPYADLIVNAVPPLDKQRESTRLTMQQVDSFNKAIAAMCKEEGWYFLNSSEALKDPKTGWAKKDYTLGDGVHLSKNGVTALFEYIRTHALITPDTRPKPLKPVPRAKGVPPGLIENDPIAVRGAKVPVNFVVKGEGSIEGNTTQMVKKGLQCSAVTAVPAEGWFFSHWTATIGHVDDSSTITFTVPGDADANGVVITAVFQEEERECEHDWEEIESKEPTCTEDGFVKYRCKLCQEETVEPWRAQGHQFQNGFCIICGEPDPEQAQPSPTPAPTPEHNWVPDHLDPTCSAPGYDRERCSICGQVRNEVTLQPTGRHSFVDGFCIFCGAQDPIYVPPAEDELLPNDGEAVSMRPRRGAAGQN